MDTSKLRFFVKLAETCHFNRAAELSHISPSTLSRNIQQLEKELGVKLFDRDNRSVALTKKGAQFLQQARDLIQQWETVRESLASNQNDLAGSISLYCSVTASYSFLYDILARFRQYHPGIEIKLHTGDPALAISRVASGEEDIAISAHPNKLPASIRFKSFSSTPLIFIAPLNADLSAKHPPSNQNILNTIPLIISERGLARDRLNAWFRKKHITPNIYAQVSGNEAIVSMVSLGFGVGLVPKIVVDNSPLKNRVCLFEVQPDLEPYKLGVCVLNKRLKSPIVKAFWSQFAVRPLAPEKP